MRPLGRIIFMSAAVRANASPWATKAAVVGAARWIAQCLATSTATNAEAKEQLRQQSSMIDIAAAGLLRRLRLAGNSCVGGMYA